MAEWSYLTNHARALLCISHDPGVRLRDIASTLGITERSAFAIVTDLAESGYVVKERDGRRNRYLIQHHLPLPENTGRERTIGDLLPGPDASPEAQAISSERERSIMRALGEIKQEYRVALILREIEELSYEEIADTLSISIGTVKSRIARGREELRRRVKGLI